MAAASVQKLYRSVIEDVVNNIREAFLDEGVDEQVLIELKQIWEKKLAESKAVDHREPESFNRHITIPSNTARLQQPHQTVQTATHVAQPAIAHQLTLSAGNLVQQALLQYASEGGDGQKTVTLTVPQKVTITLPAHLAAQGGLQTVMSAPAATATLALPPEVTMSILQQAALNNQGGMLNAARVQSAPVKTDQQGNAVHFQAVTSDQLAAKQPQFAVAVAQPTASGTTQRVPQSNNIVQLDGTHYTTDEEEDDDDFDDEDDNEEFQNEDNTVNDEEEAPLNSDDDVSEDDPSELFDTDNVVVCQYDKVTRSRNRWKFHLKDGIMNLHGKDYAFQKVVGDAEW